MAVDGWGDCDLDDAFDAADPPPGEGTRGGRMLVELADVLRGAGVAVEEVDGWPYRARSGAGFPASGPVGDHRPPHRIRAGDGRARRRPVHDARLRRQADGEPLPRPWRPLVGLRGGGHEHQRQGWPAAARCPQDSANSRVIGIEAGNNGVGEPWPDAMQDSYVAGVAALAAAYGIDPAHVYAHHEWAPGRKIDPAGPSRFGSRNQHSSWDMDRVPHRRRRSAAACRRRTQPVDSPVPAAPASATYVVQRDDSWWSIAAALLGDPARTWPVLAAANGGPQRVLHPGDVLTVPAPDGTRGGRRRRHPTVPRRGPPGRSRRGRAGLAGRADRGGRDLRQRRQPRRPLRPGHGRRRASAPGVLGLVERRRHRRQPHLDASSTAVPEQHRAGMSAGAVGRRSRSADRARHASRWPAMHVTVPPPTQMVASASCDTWTRPARPSAPPWLAT